MGATSLDGADRTDGVEQRETKYYLPGTATLSADPGPVERVVTTVFRRRGDVPLSVFLKDR